ncbi:ARM repeat-containing protein [Glarea lozoyensis ATCC 20868]|uniref:ARM repeat-containing protein n=1 Tax=Glarea lozoyensis (strain ATCC 20868 / MF5171) TaxID=1116229 RepID=S3CXL0_GLAL2|nr:ARM repeat-containing protein [Glarea lozoyensis ATCC 20868]EPE30325.1 ARM repeat-containing protein [Glarea lozoyensis ATCC 20868]
MSVSTPRTSSSTAELTGTAKLEDLTKIMANLKQDLTDIHLLPHQRDAFLEQVKVYGRDPTNADPIFTKEGLETLARHAFNSASQNTALNASRCLANAMLLRPETRQMIVDQGYIPKACTKLKIDNRDNEFVVSRIIFLATYAPELDIARLIDDEKLADNMCLNMNRHAKRYSALKSGKPQDPMADMALTETLKLLFNITSKCPEKVDKFSPALHHVLTVLSKMPISSSAPLENLVATVLNALVNLDFDGKNTTIVFPKSNPAIYTDCFIEILDKATNAYKDDELESLVSPLIVVLQKTYEVAPVEIKSQFRKSMLPSTTDREQPLGRGQTLPSRLLSLSTNPATPTLRTTVSALLFEMSDRDAKKFVQNVGYGFASGFLFQHGVTVPENALEAWSNEDDTPSAVATTERPINPVTGQFLDREEHVEIDMTDEEKEREAERLFVLFERLRATGVVDVQNPVTQARQEGRFEELPDDSD